MISPFYVDINYESNHGFIDLIGFNYVKLYLLKDQSTQKKKNYLVNLNCPFQRSAKIDNGPQI